MDHRAEAVLILRFLLYQNRNAGFGVLVALVEGAERVRPREFQVAILGPFYRFLLTLEWRSTVHKVVVLKVGVVAAQRPRLARWPCCRGAAAKDKLAPFKRLPSGWEVHKPAEVFTRRAGGHQLWLVNSDYGWLIERKELFGAEQVLASIFMGFPVLCDTHVMAARLAEAAYQGLRPEYQLTWISTT